MDLASQLSGAFYLASSPLLLLAGASLIMLLQGLVHEGGSKPPAVAITLLGSLGLCFGFYSFVSLEPAHFLGGALVSDGLSLLGQLLILFLSIFFLVLAYNSAWQKQLFRPDCACLLLMSITGALILVATDDLVTLLIGLELSSLGAYALVGYSYSENRSQEAAIKYLVLGSFATGFMLFGFSLLYFSSGSLLLSEIFHANVRTHGSIWWQLGSLLSLIGLGFKLALVPFHSWAPDTYEGSPSTLAGYLASSGKVMILILLLRVMGGYLPELLQSQWQGVFLILAWASMILGNGMALVQSNLKRFLAYSSVAHSGYLAMALAAGGENLSQAVIFYSLAYGCGAVLSFGVISNLESKVGQYLTLDDLKGLSKRHPYAALALTIAMLSFAGLPPTAGFIAKFLLFKVTLEQGLIVTAILAALTSLVALYFYLRLLVFMYMHKPEEVEIQQSFAPASKVLFAVTIGAVFYLGTLPATVLERVGVHLSAQVSK